MANRRGWGTYHRCSLKVVTLLAIFSDVIQYITNRADQLRTQEIQAKKPFLEKRLEFYIEATRATATIATSKNPDDIAGAREKFWILYWGPMLVLEDPKVHESMNHYAACMEDASKCKAPLRELSRQLALAASVSVGNQWNVVPRPPTNLKAE